MRHLSVLGRCVSPGAAYMRGRAGTSKAYIAHDFLFEYTPLLGKLLHIAIPCQSASIHSLQTRVFTSMRP